MLVALAFVAVMAVDPSLQAGAPDAAVRETAYARVRLAEQVAHDPVIVRAVVAQDARKATLADIQARDAAWMKDPKLPLRKQILDAPCSARLKELVGADPHVVEAFVMDDKGALVCSVAETSDYWQGDEAKWQKTFQEGKDPFVDEPAFDASSGTYAIQVSVPVPDGKERVGAVTLTLKLRGSASPGR